jgi:glycosyltransferase involved in cell wall biosynthesis
MNRDGGSGAIRLVEVGLDWPPETYLQWKIERLAAMGFEVTVTSVGRRAVSEPVPGVRLVRTPTDGHRASAKLRSAVVDAVVLLTRTPMRGWQLLRGVREVAPPPGVPHRWRRVAGSLPLYLRLARLRPDVVHFEWEQTAVACQPLVDVWRCPIVLSCHGVLNVARHRAVHKRWLRRLPATLSRAAAVCCASERLRESAIVHGADPEAAVVMHSAVDAEHFRPPERQPEERKGLRVIAVGTLRWMKGYEYSLVAMAKLVEQGIDVRFDILGGDPPAGMREPGQMRRILATSDDLGLHGRVHPHGKVASDVVRRMLQQADVFLNASVSEGLPTALLEAMASGLPVVVSDCGDVRQAVTDGVEGIVVPPRDTERMAAAMARLWADPSVRARMGAAGRSRVLEAFALQQRTDDFARLYRQLSNQTEEAPA